MSTLYLLDPELHPLLEMLPNEDLTDATVANMRQFIQDRAELTDAAASGVSRDEVFVSGGDGDPDVRCLIYRPVEVKAGCPAFLHIHGGGYVAGVPEMADAMNVRVASHLGIVVVSVDYRLAPEHPFPGPLEDCYSVLAWMHTKSDELGIDSRKIAIGGDSAGGGLAAALAILARDRSAYSVCHQQLTYPMLDDRTGSADLPRDPLVGEFVWTRQKNQYGWASYLGEAEAQAPQVPARVETVKGLPSTAIITVALDLFLDENLDYARRLTAAGIATDLIVYPSACHGFALMPGTSLSQRYVQDYLVTLSRGLGLPLSNLLSS